MTNKANYRKYNDGSHNSSKYHKKDGTPIRAIPKRESAVLITPDGNKFELSSMCHFPTPPGCRIAIEGKP